MARLIDWLNDEGFNWENGIIVFHDLHGGDDPGWERDPKDIKDSKVIYKNHPILNKKFYDGYGSPQCPRIFAKDNDAVYFPQNYDGATSLVKVMLDENYYLKGNPTPYPGGG